MIRKVDKRGYSDRHFAPLVENLKHSPGSLSVLRRMRYHDVAGCAPRAKVAPFAGGNIADVRKTAGAPSPQASFSNELGGFARS